MPARARPNRQQSMPARALRVQFFNGSLVPHATKRAQVCVNVLLHLYTRVCLASTNFMSFHSITLVNHAGKGARAQNQGRFLCLKIVPHFLCDLLVIHNAKLISQNMLLFKTNAAPPPMRRQSRARRVHNAGRRRARRARPQLRTSINKLTQFQHLKKC